MTSIVGISSMAVRPVIADLVKAFEQESGWTVAIESVGGVDAKKRVQAGETFDLVILASNVIDDLIDERRLVAGTRVDLVRSGMAVAVPVGVPHPGIGSEDAVKAAVIAAPRICHSTGPSGVYLLKLFERWGIADAVKPKIVQAPPGISVGKLLARGDADLGFQQLSELLALPGVDVVGPLPPAIQLMTVFAAGTGAQSSQIDAVRRLTDFMNAPQAAVAKARHGMEPA